jgi:biofilm PGA synthesis N-glycosyltransferase PgaC
MFPYLMLAILLIGVNTILWSAVGLVRVLASWRSRFVPQDTLEDGGRATTPPDISHVAVVIAAHNEELVIGNTLRSLESLVPPSHVFVVSDGSHDRTAEIARRHGAKVLELHANRGKAGAIVEVLESFDIPSRFDVVLLLDADTQLTPQYFETGLALFDRPDVVAVAGRASTLISPQPPTALGRFLVAYRNRVYIAMQYLFKFGQAARGANVVAIVPGFASMYRTRVLGSIDIDAPGLKIEDYNMTFEIHAKKLGSIAFHPHAAIAMTQDPDRFRQYVSQVERWNLGFWQTVGRHEFRLQKFWLSLTLFIIELLVSSVLLILLIPALVISLSAAAITALGLDPTGSAEIITDLLPPLVIVFGIFIPDYLLTLLAAVVARQPKYLVLGLAFPLLRILDAILCIRGLLAAVSSSPVHQGRWQSPERRKIDGVPATAQSPVFQTTVPAKSSAK